MIHQPITVFNVMAKLCTDYIKTVFSLDQIISPHFSFVTCDYINSQVLYSYSVNYMKLLMQYLLMKMIWVLN